MNKDIRFLDSRMFKRISLFYYPQDLTDLSTEYFLIDGSRIVKGSFNLTETVNAGEEWKPGLPNKSVLRVKVSLNEINYALSAGDIIEAVCDTYVPPDASYSTRQRTRLGCFVVDTIEKNENSELYDITAYSYGLNSAQDALHDIEMRKLEFWNFGESVNYNIPVDALALEAFGYAFGGVYTPSAISKTGDSNRTIARFDRTSSGWKSLVLEFDFYQTGNMDKGWNRNTMYRPSFAMDGISEALNTIKQYFDASAFKSDSLNLLQNAMYTHYSYNNTFPASIVSNSTTEEFADILFGQSNSDILIKPNRYIYGYQPISQTMPGSTCVIIPTGVSIWQISGTGRTKSASRLYQKSITKRRKLWTQNLRSVSDYVTISSFDDGAYEDVTAENVLNAYAEFKGIKLLNNREFSPFDIISSLKLTSKEYTGTYDDSLLYPEDELNPSNTLYPASGSDYAIIPVGSGMISSIKIDVNERQHRYGKAIIPNFVEEEVYPVQITGVSGVGADDHGIMHFYDRTYDLLNNVYIKLKGYTVEQIKALLSSNGFWTKMSRVPDNPKCTLKATGLPFIEAGEFVNVYSKNKFIPLMVSQRTMRGEQGMTDEITTKPLPKTI